MQQWEYQYVETWGNNLTHINGTGYKDVEETEGHLRGPQPLPLYLTFMGLAGWELVGATNQNGFGDRLFFKRPKQ